MAAHVLVVATVTAASDDLLAALRERVRAQLGAGRLHARDARARPPTAPANEPQPRRPRSSAGARPG